MPNIYYLPDELTIDADARDTILQTSLYADIPHMHVCGGFARCSTCRVLIADGVEACSPPTVHEQILAKKLDLPDHIRLACQTRINGDIRLRRLVLDSEDAELAEQQISYGAIGQEKPVAIMFADIRGFTKASEAMLPYDVIYLLNRYFQRMNKVIISHGGVINNYMGDGFMALFGLEDIANPVELSVRAGLAMLEQMEALNHGLTVLSNHPLKIGIGIHYGWVVLGNIGNADASSSCMTAIGDAVNFASRIESTTKRVGASLLVSEEVYENIKSKAIAKPHNNIELAGKTGAYCLYEITEMRGNLNLPQTAATQLAAKRKLNAQRAQMGIFESIFSIVMQAIEKLFNAIARLFRRHPSDS
ncbi:adenylate/guanylate cyclase [Thalassoporum mexicanum PCC 7367]|uniref:adenylate/guanylate cyclase domain-containing protein n=1 Tax=Thalassoporum mexicanum TaxID=3457544 RepID=UPI00029FB8C7|nr:adenylate/guanylate cyclase domain-containing protein [Pseudanabaena sp. PCC 7367]AFY70442.1 adenylate/guanylate cyclase [Pseudanabaena sp. PCC 7367]